MAEDQNIPQENPPTTRQKDKKNFKCQSMQSRLFKIFYCAILGMITYSIILVLSLRWISPWKTMFMVEHFFENLFDKKRTTPIEYQWQSWDSISRHVPLAVVAAEDQKFPFHRGFDFESISTALVKNRNGRRIRGASTITQQVAKNLFLWSGKWYARKGLEAYFTILLELLWPKQRILEVYVNIAEFGDGVYGVQAAAQKFFRKNADRLNPDEAALLAAVLPNPKRFKVSYPSKYIQSRKTWILEQMEQLGGISYLEN